MKDDEELFPAETQGRRENFSTGFLGFFGSDFQSF
jgi:hypothetical protein